MFKTAILTILLSLPAKYGENEKPEDRQARMELLADAIDQAVENSDGVWKRPKRELASYLITLGWWESKFAKNVHEGKCLAYECDPFSHGGQVYHRAASVWQLQATRDVNLRDIIGIENTYRAAEAAVRVISRGTCGSTPEKIISSYATGSRICNWKGAPSRVKTFEKILQQLSPS